VLITVEIMLEVDDGKFIDAEGYKIGFVIYGWDIETGD
jgi:hypothetical protein